MPQVTSKQQQQVIGKLRRLMARYLEVELLLRVGEYQYGEDLQTDDAIKRRDIINQFLCQDSVDQEHTYTLDTLVEQLEQLLSQPC